MSKWSAIVYSRTYEVDFRFITIPDYFSNEDETWVETYILGTTKSTESLEVQPRWSFFKNERYCVVGVTCLASDLVNPKNLRDEDRTKDFKKRDVFAFVGYVAQMNQEQVLLSFPPYTGRNLEIFRSLYQQYVCNPNIWFIKEYETEYETHSMETIKSKGREFIYSKINESADLNLQKYQLQVDGAAISLWPDSEKNREKLWVSVTRHATAYPNRCLSLCLSLSTQSEAFDSPFWNATTLDIVEPVSIQREKPVGQEKTSIEEEIRQPSSLSTISKTGRTEEYNPKKQIDSRDSSSQIDSKNLVAMGAGMTIGGLVGWKIGGLIGLIPGGFIGGGIAWLAASWLTDVRDERYSLNVEQEENNSYRDKPQQQNQASVELDYGFSSNKKPKKTFELEDKENKKSSWF